MLKNCVKIPPLLDFPKLAPPLEKFSCNSCKAETQTGHNHLGWPVIGCIHIAQSFVINSLAEIKIFACGKKLARSKSLLVSKQISYMGVKVRWILSFSFRSKSDLQDGIRRTYQSEQENANKSAFAQAKVCTQQQAFNVNAG